MKTHLRLPLLLGATCIALSALASTPARAESTMSDDRWQFSARLYGWFPSVSGDLKYDLPGVGNRGEIGDAPRIMVRDRQARADIQSRWRLAV